MEMAKGIVRNQTNKSFRCNTLTINQSKKPVMRNEETIMNKILSKELNGSVRPLSILTDILAYLSL
jgi:hypothetical protein